MKILLITPFKVGSNTLSHILQTKYNYIQVYEQNKKSQEYYLTNKNFILRGHTKLNYKVMNDNKYDICFTLIRKPSDIYISGYFQDISTKGYPYCYGSRKKVLQTNKISLLKHFLSFEWNTFDQFSFDFNFNEILKYTNIDIWNEPFDVNKGFSIYQSPVKKIKVVVLTMESLFSNINEIIFRLGISKDMFSHDKKINCGNNKWYKKQYDYLKNNLPPSYRIKYFNDDKKIIDKFYKK